jgi:hypothetical protein
MYCTKCGAANDDNAYKCTGCGQVLVRSPGAIDAGGLGPAQSPLVWAILCTLFCCLPGGIVAIVYSAQVSGKNSDGRFAEAHELARKGRMWCWISFGVGLVVMALWIALNVIGAVAKAQRY